MKAKLMAGVMAAALWAVPALAMDDVSSTTTQTTPAGSGQTTTTTTTTADPSMNAPAAMPMAPDALSTPAPAPVAMTPDYQREPAKKKEATLRGVSVVVGGGVEGYTGDLAPQINPGPTWGARVAIRPTKVLGLELGYSGAANNIDNSRGEFTSGAVGGPDIVRNGGEAAVTVGLAAAAVQPYLLGGVGYSHYNVRAPGEGFRSDNTGNIPVGAGLRTQVGAFTADARFGYSILFNNEFAQNVAPRDVAGINSTSGGRYNGTVNLGTTF